MTTAHMNIAWTYKKHTHKNDDFVPHFSSFFLFSSLSFPFPFSPFQRASFAPSHLEQAQTILFDSTSKLEVKNDFFSKIFFELCPILEASNLLLIMLTSSYS